MNNQDLTVVGFHCLNLKALRTSKPKPLRWITIISWYLNLKCNLSGLAVFSVDCFVSRVVQINLASKHHQFQVTFVCNSSAYLYVETTVKQTLYFSKITRVIEFTAPIFHSSHLTKRNYSKNWPKSEKDIWCIGIGRRQSWPQEKKLGNPLPMLLV